MVKIAYISNIRISILTKYTLNNNNFVIYSHIQCHEDIAYIINNELRKVYKMNSMEDFGDNLLVKLVIFEYKHAQKALSVRLAGSKAIALSPAYFQTFNEELTRLRTIFKDLASFIASNFVIEVQVDTDGTFKHNEMKGTFVKSLNRENGGKMAPIANVFYEVEKILPFAEYMHEIHLYSYKHSLCNFEVHLNISLEDIIETFNYPLVAPRARQQWLDVMSDFDNYSKGHYTCSSCYPVVDGELEVDGMMYYLHAREIFRRVQ